MILKIPIELSEIQIEEFQRIYKKNFNEDISKDEAVRQGLSLIRFVAIILDNRD